ncbi:MAG: hypothetical protein KAI17_09660, partial [Thiotrichaceae bacterium]|nr:hypothetical protein [Thiotrichaceae bacterium]
MLTGHQRLIEKHSQFLSIILFFLAAIPYQETSAMQEINASQDSNSTAGLQLNIMLEGLTAEEKKNALAYLEINKNLNNPQLNIKRLKLLHNQAETNIQQSLQPFGYYNVTLESYLELDSKGVWQAKYHISTGKRIQFNKIDIEISGPGKNDSAIINAQKKFPIKTNDFLDHDIYESAKLELLNSIGKLGYADVKTEKKQLLINPANNSAELILHLNTGQQYYLGEFRFHQDSLDMDLLQRYTLDHTPGDVYSQKSLLSLQQSLISSGYFSIVDIKPEFTETKNQHVPIDITLKPVKKHKLSLGLGYDTEIEVNTSARWQNRLLNSAGHNSDILLKLSDKISTLKGTYWMPSPLYDWLPGKHPATDKIGLSTKFETESVDATDRNTLDMDASYIFKLKDWDAKLFIEYKFESYEVGDLEDSNSNLFSLGGRLEGFFFEPGVYPRTGWAFSGELRGTPAEILSSTRYLRLHLKSKVILPILSDGRMLLRGELGLAEVNDFEQYPTSLRFYAGGD